MLCENSPAFTEAVEELHAARSSSEAISAAAAAAFADESPSPVAPVSPSTAAELSASAELHSDTHSSSGLSLEDSMAIEIHDELDEVLVEEEPVDSAKV